MGFREVGWRGLLVLCCTLVSCFSCALGVAVGSLRTPRASFVFGDSLVDAGNNNYLPRSLATARKLPNGIDFPTINARNPTGRFTNGLTIPDLIGVKLGIQSFSPPFLAPTTKGSAILNGVNYASGGAGILNDTGRIFVQRISMDMQISYFEQTVAEITQILGANEAQSLLSDAIFSVTMGANDFMGNYLFPIPTTSERTIPSQQYIQKLIVRFKEQLELIYNLGGRKFVVVNVPIIGCTPYLRSLNVKGGGKCSSEANQLAIDFNARLKGMLDELNAALSGATFLYADAYGLTAEITSNYKAYGFDNAEKACCGLAGSEKGIVPCRYPFVPMCSDRSKYFFWDPYHPTQNAYEIIANEFLDGSQFISPMNIRQLLAD